MFLNPIMLAGLAGAMLPLVLHLLNRARYRNMTWGAMMFLGTEDRQQSRRARMKEMLLLLVRMGMIGLLALALARPVLAPAGSLTDGPSCTVIILDRSGSMGIAENGPARQESAVRAALSVISDLLSNHRSGDEAVVIQTPDIPGTPISLTTDLQRLGMSLADVRAAGGRADMASALDAAAELLERSHGAFKHLVIICDRQAASWRDVNESLARRWRAKVNGSAGARVKLTVIPIGGQEVGNVAVESVQVANPPVIRDVPAEIEVRVHNYDTIPSAAIPLTIRMGNEELHRATVNLDAGASATIRCSVRFPKAGSVFITARLNQSGLTADDTMEAAVEVTEPIGVLVISGDERGQSATGFRAESDFIRLALAPFAVGEQPGADLAKVKVVTSDEWPEELDRTKHQVVVLANVPRLVLRQVQQIEQFVYGGGGLLIAPGNLSRTEDYNGQLWRGGTGILPAELLAPTAADGSGATTLLGAELSHSIFQFLKGRDEPIPRVMFSRYFPTRAIESQARVLAQYASGQPYLIENSYGRGRIMLVTSPLDADWNELPISNVYLPLLQSAVRYLAAGMLPDRNLSSGDPMVAMIDDPVEQRATMDAPGNRVFPVELVRVGDAYEARFTNTTRPGPYMLRVQSERGPRQIRFSVRAPRDESDMTNLSPERWTSLQNMLGFDTIEPEPREIAQAAAESRRRLELWSWLLAGVVVLGISEIWIARSWSAAAREELP